MNHLSNSRYNLDHFGTSSRHRRLSGQGLWRAGRHETTRHRAELSARRCSVCSCGHSIDYTKSGFSVRFASSLRRATSALILDGNRRYARKYGATDPHQIYALGARKLDEVLEWCCELRIPAVTLWAVSTDDPQLRSQVSLPPSRRRWRRSPRIPVFISNGFA